MITSVAVILMVAISSDVSTPAPNGSSITVKLDEAIRKTREMAYRSDQIDWPSLEARVRIDARGAKDVIDLMPALNTLVEGLGDGHSFVNASGEQRAAFKTRHGHEFDDQRKTHQITSRFTARRDPGVIMKPAGKRQVAVATVPMMLGGGPRATVYAQTLHDGLVARSKEACGYVVDLRGNGGGNVWPMLVGLSPLLGSYRSRERNPAGAVTSYAAVADGKATIIDPADENAGRAIVEIAGARPDRRLASAPVAVLIDDGTASSGEGVAVAFRGRPATRFFGARTFGVASSNEGFMVDGKINVVVTTAMMVDRNGKTYPKGIPADVPGSGAIDPLVTAARWLSRQPTCR